MNDNPPISYTPVIWNHYSTSAKVLDACASLDDALSDLKAEGIDVSESKSAEVQSHKKYAEIEVEHKYGVNGVPYITYLYYQSI